MWGIENKKTNKKTHTHMNINAKLAWIKCIICVECDGMIDRKRTNGREISLDWSVCIAKTSKTPSTHTRVHAAPWLKFH